MTAAERSVRDRIGRRLEALGERHPSMKAFRRTKHVSQYGFRYVRGLTTTANPEYSKQLEKSRETIRKENLGGKAAILREECTPPPPGARLFGTFLPNPDHGPETARVK